MNIAFYTSYELSPYRGGTERVTLSVAKALKTMYGHRCYSLYGTTSDGFEVEHLDGGLCCSKSNVAQQIADFIKLHHIDIFISQGAFDKVKSLREELGPDTFCSLLLVHHFEPGFEAYLTNRTRLKKSIIGKSSLKAKLRSLFWFVFLEQQIARARKRLQSNYRTGYESADCVVLLSKGFIRPFEDFAGIEDSSKFRIIPNMLSFNDVQGIDFMTNKKKEVLIVSRLTEPPKRISVALRIWNIVRKSAISDGWTLRIVGHGEHEGLYKRMVEKEKIPNVVFHGVQDPRKYYERAAIFMMTSKSEGWGLTLTESMQYGVVPIAFDSYASVRDIITDGVDGYLIRDMDLQLYADRILLLMQDSGLRESIAKKACTDCYRFSSENVGRKWSELLHEIYETKARVD